MDVQRIQYLKTDGGSPKHVLYENDALGVEQFSEQELGATEWTSFTPSEDERAVARRIRNEANKKDGILNLYHEQSNLTIRWWR